MGGMVHPSSMEPLGPEIEPFVSEVTQALARGRQVYVEGAIGSGRNTLVERLQSETGAFVLELLPLVEVDAPATACIELASALSPDDRPRLTGGGARSYYDVASALRTRLADHSRSLVVRLPASWANILDRDNNNGVTADAKGFFQGLTRAGISVVIVADAAISPRDMGLLNCKELRLPGYGVPVTALELVEWGAYAPAWQALRDAAAPGGRWSPITLRLGVGLVALGATPAEAWSRMDLGPFALAQAIAQRAVQIPGLGEALRTMLTIRRPMDIEALRSLVAAPAEHEPLFTQCIGYGSDRVRVAEPVRNGLRMPPGSDARGPTQTHRTLAEHYRSLDGAMSPADLDTASVRAWAEKVHHMANADDAMVEEWGQQQLAGPEQYWERARRLSEQKRFVPASEVYRRCVKAFPEDDYGWHYLGWNLQRAHGDRTEIERCYRSAIGLAPENPWWNTRLMTFLIEDGQPGAAKKEWAAVVGRVDPDGDEVGRSPWLGRHLHAWVSRSWLNAGRGALAADVLRGIPNRFQRLRGRLSYVSSRVERANPRAQREDPRWVAFLADMAARCGVTEAHAEHARALWQTLRTLGGPELPIPMADRTADEARVQFCWSYATVYLEVEVTADGARTWFGLDRARHLHEAETPEGDDAALARWLQRVIDG